MIMAIATLRVHPEKISEYEDAVRELLPQVRSNEAGVMFYDVGKSQDEPNVYRVVEVYLDDTALAVHRQSKFVAAAKPAMFACLDGDIEIRMHRTL
jgi:quinol monooxygenase YgiN